MPLSTLLFIELAPEARLIPNLLKSTLMLPSAVTFNEAAPFYIAAAADSILPSNEIPANSIVYPDTPAI
jgi:hypothetical protein